MEPLLVYYLNKELNNIFSNSKVSSAISWTMVIITVLLIAIAIQNNEEKVSKKGSMLTPFKYLSLIMMGMVGGAFATYVGVTDLGDQIPAQVIL